MSERERERERARARKRQRAKARDLSLRLVMSRCSMLQGVRGFCRVLESGVM